MKRSVGWFAIALSIVLAIGLAIAAPALAQSVPEAVTFTARISDNGAPLTGSHEFVFKIFDAASGGTEVWTETATIALEDGLVFHELGQTTPLDATVLGGGRLFLDVSVDGIAMAPRMAVVSVPYAVRAGVAQEAQQLSGGLAASDFITGVLPGDGITGGGDTGDVMVAVSFGGSGAATTASRSDHTHAYLPIGSTLACGSGSFATGLNGTTGDLVCSTPSAAGDITSDTIADDGVISDGELADTITVGPMSTVAWTALTGFPGACPPGQAMAAVGDLPTCVLVDTSTDTIGDDGVISDAELSDTITVGATGNVAWSSLSSYPAACPPGQAITALNDGPTCGSFDNTADTIADDGIINDAEAADALSISNGSLHAPNVASNVGIGTITPTAPLQISRTGAFTESCAGATVANGSGIKFRDDPGGGCGDYGYLAYSSIAADQTRLEIAVGNDVDDDIAMRASSGVVHFGDATALRGQISVGAAGRRAGAAGFDPPTTGAETGVWLEGGSAEAGGFYADGDVALVYSPGDPDLFRIYDEDGMVLRFYVDGVGNARVANGFTTGCLQDGDGTAIAGTCASDRRLKTAIRPFEDVLDRVVRLQPVHYRWRADEFPERRFGTEETYGLIAQDVEAVMPEMVATDLDGYRMVDYSQVPLLLLQALKEEHERVQSLESGLEELRADNAELAARVRDIEDRGGMTHVSLGSNGPTWLAIGLGAALLAWFVARRRASAPALGRS